MIRSVGNEWHRVMVYSSTIYYPRAWGKVHEVQALLQATDFQHGVSVTLKYLRWHAREILSIGIFRTNTPVSPFFVYRCSVLS